MPRRSEQLEAIERDLVTAHNWTTSVTRTCEPVMGFGRAFARIDRVTRSASIVIASRESLTSELEDALLAHELAHVHIAALGLPSWQCPFPRHSSSCARAALVNAAAEDPLCDSLAAEYGFPVDELLAQDLEAVTACSVNEEVLAITLLRASFFRLQTSAEHRFAAQRAQRYLCELEVWQALDPTSQSHATRLHAASRYWTRHG